MESKTPARVSRSRHLAPSLLPVLVSLIVWADLFRFWFPQGDDFLFTAIHPGPGIDLGVRDLLSLAADDWLHRNGRLSDSLMRLVMSQGMGLFPWLAPVLLTLGGWVLGKLLARNALLVHRRWVEAGGLLVIPTALALWPGQTGDVVFWGAGFMNYVAPLAGLFAVADVLGRVAERMPVRKPILIASAVMAPLVQVLHEQTSFALLGIALGAILVRRGRLERDEWLIPAGCALGFALTLVAPGLWARRERLVEQPELIDRLNSMGVVIGSFVNASVVAWAILLVVLVTRVARVQRASWLSWAALGLTGWLVAASVLNVGTMSTTWHRSVVLFVAVAAVLAVFFTLQDISGTSAVLWAGVWLALTPGIIAGISGDRSQFIAYLLLLVSVLRLVGAPSLDKDGRLSMVTVALMLVLGATWWLSVRPRLAENSRFVEQKVVPQMLAAARGERQKVLVTKALPNPALTYSNAWLATRYTQSWKNYWGITQPVTFQQVPAKKLR